MRNGCRNGLSAQTTSEVLGICGGLGVGSWLQGSRRGNDSSDGPWGLVQYGFKHREVLLFNDYICFLFMTFFSHMGILVDSCFRGYSNLLISLIPTGLSMLNQLKLGEGTEFQICKEKSRMGMDGGDSCT